MNTVKSSNYIEILFEFFYIIGIIYFSIFNFTFMGLILSIFCLLGTIVLGYLFRKNIIKEKTLYYTLVVFLFFSSFLGSSFNFYQIPHYDDFLHIWSGFICVAVAWNILLFFCSDMTLNKWFILIFLFMFSMGCASLWEISEFLMDSTIGTTCQQGLLDTNTDMIDCFIGSIIMCLYYLKKLHKN